MYVCEEHAKELGNSANVRASDGHLSGEAAKNNETETSAETQPVAVSKKASSAASKAESSSSEAPRQTTKPAQSPAEQCAAINRLISDLAAQLERILSQSEATLSLVDTIDAPLEQAALEVIGNQAMTETQKDAAVQQLGALQESLKQEVGLEMTPLKAHRIKETVGNCLSGDTNVVDEAKPGYRAVYDGLENAIHTAVPKAKHLEQRLDNLLKMRAELENLVQAKKLAPAVA